ncbi:MAG: hypothetical protein Q7S82_00545 [bacterium]|nr:hypothetical protein [bacterium]
MPKKVIDIFPPQKKRDIGKSAIPEKAELKAASFEEKTNFKPEKQINISHHTENATKKSGGFLSGFKIKKSSSLTSPAPESIKEDKSSFLPSSRKAGLGQRGVRDESKNIHSSSPFATLGQMKKRTQLSSFFLLGFAFLFLTFAASYLTLSAAKIEIWPKGEVVNFDAKLTVDKNKDKADFSAKIIPGQIIEEKKTISDTFFASGKIKKENKAEGIIRVYNANSVSAQVLLANTRFVSASGKLFKTPSRVTIPGAWYDKGKLIPGEVDVKVAADQPGLEYNIEPTTFSIPGFAGTEKYTKFYGKSFQQMSGGFSEEIIQITEADLRKAEDILTKKAKEEAEAALKNDLKKKEGSEGINLESLASGIQTEVGEKFTSGSIGAEMEKFEYKIGVKSSVLVFQKDDLVKFAKEFILSQIAQDKKINEDSLKINFTPDLNNASLSKINLALAISAKIYSDIDILFLKKVLQGKTQSETKAFLENQSGVVKVKVEFWPFWVKRAPEAEQKIKIKLNLD